MVHVIDFDGKPLMPTERYAHVRKLLRDGKAIVVMQMPFTIQLVYDSERYRQRITLGVDVGIKYVGLSATTTKKEVFAAVGEVRTDVKKRVDDKRMYRKGRRGRKTRCREARFDNRHNSRKKGRYGPTAVSRVLYHTSLIDLACSILPVTDIVLENGGFDTQKMQNPGIEGCEYQQGLQLGYENVKAYVLARDNHTCQKCHKKNVPLNVHHIIHRANGGTDRPENLITLCKDCHGKYHAGEIKLNIRKPQLMREPAGMNVMRNLLIERVKELVGDSVEVLTTYGYITKYNRRRLGLEKTHDTDAFVITGNSGAKRLGYVYKSKQLRCHKRQLYDGKIRKGGKRHSVNGPHVSFGYRLYDVVRYGSVLYYITSRRASGCFELTCLSDGHKVNRSYKKLRFVRSSSGKWITGPEIPPVN